MCEFNVSVADPIFQTHTLLMGGGGKNTPKHISTSRRDRNTMMTATLNFENGHSNGTTGDIEGYNRKWKIQDGHL